jgi:hypothetical protein
MDVELLILDCDEVIAYYCSREEGKHDDDLDPPLPVLENQAFI